MNNLTQDKMFIETFVADKWSGMSFIEAKRRYDAAKQRIAAAEQRTADRQRHSAINQQLRNARQAMSDRIRSDAMRNQVTIEVDDRTEAAKSFGRWIRSQVFDRSNRGSFSTNELFRSEDV